MITGSFNLRKNYTSDEIRSFIVKDPAKAEKLIHDNLKILGSIKENSKLWFDLEGGTIRLDEKPRQWFRKGTSMKDELHYLVNFKRFAKQYFSHVTKKDKVSSFKDDLESASKGLEILSSNLNLKEKCCKVSASFQKLKKNIDSMSKMKMENPLPFIKGKIKVRKLVCDIKNEQMQRQILKETFSLLKDQVKEVQNEVKAALSPGEKKRWENLKNNCTPLFKGNTAKKADMELSLFTEFLIVKDQKKKLNKLNKKLSEIAGYGTDVKTLKQAAFRKSGLFFYTTDILPKKSKKEPDQHPVGVQIRHYTMGIGKLAVGLTGIILGVIFPSAVYLVGGGYLLITAGTNQLMDGIKNDPTIGMGRNIKDALKKGVRDPLAAFNDLSKMAAVPEKTGGEVLNAVKDITEVIKKVRIP